MGTTQKKKRKNCFFFFKGFFSYITHWLVSAELEKKRVAFRDVKKCDGEKDILRQKGLASGEATFRIRSSESLSGVSEGFFSE